MAAKYGLNIVSDGIVDVLESNDALGGTNQVVRSRASTGSFQAYNMSVNTSYNFKKFQSNALSDGSGSSSVVSPINPILKTGSITFMIWFNVNGIPVNVGGNNNWRGLLCTNNGGTSGSPLTMVMEQGNVINFSTTHTDSYRRYLAGNFAPFIYNSNGWQMLTYTYTQSTGQAAAYKNDQLVLSGPMTTDGSGNGATAPGTALLYSNYDLTGFRIYGGTTTSANPNGNGICPGLLGSVYIYNRGLTQSEIIQNYDATAGRYGL